MTDTHDIALTHDHRAWTLEGGCNFRDIGGYRASDGRSVKWGMLFRSGTLGMLTDADWERMRAAGIRAVCDFRTSRECASEPFAWRDSQGLSYFARDHETSFAELQRVLHSDVADADSARRAMMEGYRRLPFDQADAYRAMFAFVRAGDVPLLFNCSAGKDRTGVAAALLLSALGVPRETVIGDYLLTERLGNLEARMAKRGGGETMLTRRPPEVVRAILGTDGDYLTAALDEISGRHGGIETYFDEVLGVSEADREAFRDRLLEEPA